jgi:hypothetical protein
MSELPGFNRRRFVGAAAAALAAVPLNEERTAGAPKRAAPLHAAFGTLKHIASFGARHRPRAIGLRQCPRVAAGRPDIH